MSDAELLNIRLDSPIADGRHSRLSRICEYPANRLERLKGDRAGRRAITADTGLRLCRFFRLSDGWWLRLQANYDTEVAKAILAKTLAKIKPWPEMAEDALRAH